ncbi:MAG: hypothetical protein HN725_21895 [Alphaproteobacteria bacterium]|jgi:hypothetical protein|nr:hypothetical protein [Alphaproteobacteria bacterium]MBT4083601.1 hypothetical protein [Alphaproteobacteria bacterium]MBT4545123.1 hypothetical protein [Alphaproteobacteria bacterium]MBT7747954.1 hypothetical protein [Alphaproteobacteria bacterium]
MGKQHLGLKFLVIFMGILIIVGVGVVAYTIISRLASGGKVVPDKTTTAPAPARQSEKALALPGALQGKLRALKPFGDVAARIPAGAVVEEMTTDRRRLILRLRLTSGEQAVYVFNLRTGERLGSIRLQVE